uniref:Uncharacterized protein n=1 Tax=Cacopsylla melanoneura TaxID=428564 RepID=A0A8D8UTL4_9HEMI
MSQNRPYMGGAHPGVPSCFTILLLLVISFHHATLIYTSSVSVPSIYFFFKYGFHFHITKEDFFYFFPPFFFFYLYQDKSSRENTSENLVFGNKREYLARKMFVGKLMGRFFRLNRLI